MIRLNFYNNRLVQVGTSAISYHCYTSLLWRRERGVEVEEEGYGDVYFSINH